MSKYLNKKNIEKFWNLYNQLVRFCIGKVLELVHIEWSEKRWEEFLTFARFWLIGLSATLVSYLINVVVLLSIHSFDKGYDFVIANIAAFFGSVTWTFYWNTRYVFEEKSEEHRSPIKTFIKTFFSYAFTGLILNNALSYVWIYAAGISKYTAPILNLLIGFPVNYAMNRLWAYK